MADAEEKLQLYVEGVAKTLDVRPQAVLLQIPHPSRSLLALRGYLRKESEIDAKWAWSPAEIEKFYEGGEYQEVKEEVRKVKAKFEELCRTRWSEAGCTLDTKVKVRTLAQQIRKWNGNKSVITLGDDLRARTTTEIMKPEYPDPPDSSAIKLFRAYLKDPKLLEHKNPSLATPGLSDHGQLSAIDFFIRRNGIAIAEAETASIKKAWDGPGWTDRLKQAVTEASDSFYGPLKTPYEPWHYTYET